MSRRYGLFISAAFFATVALSGTTWVQGAEAAGKAHPVVRTATRSDTTVPLRQLPEIPPLPSVLGEIFVKPLKRLPHRQGGGASALDPVAQTEGGTTPAPLNDNGFEGVGNVDSVLPPDPAGAVGPNHYVQMTNLSFAVYDRNGTKLYGPVSNSTLWQGFGGPCETTNDGDPVVLYDHRADRWLMSQFALPRYPRGPFYQCIAVSQGPNPISSGWNRYEFLISNNKLNDYPKFGVWRDGYYMATNQFSCKMIFCDWGGQGVVAFERDAMLAGAPDAQMVYFDLYSVDPNLGGMLPADLDGPAPPEGTPNVFAQIDDDAWGYSPDQLQLWDFTVHWNNPSASTFTLDTAVSVAAFDSDMCGYARNCIPQPGGSNLDAISDRLMYRLQYRDFGTHQTLVVNHTVDVGDFSDHAGVRWYELNNDGSGWSIAQQGTYAPDNDHRWMGSTAMNANGDIALGYSVSSGRTSPSIRFTGRLGSDSSTPDEMTIAEGTIVDGSGYQTHSSGRWGDYSMLTVDPVDDCTFWYTQEYYNGVSSADWQTRIGSFKLADNCGSTGTPTDTPPSVSITSPADGTTVSGSISVTANASDDHGVKQVEFFVNGSSIGVDMDGSNGWTADWITNNGSYDDGAYTITATATDTIDQTGESIVNVTVQNAPVASFTYSCVGLTCSFDGSGSSDPNGDALTYSWNFGDNSALGTGATPSHTYAAGGGYTVILTVNDGQADSPPASQNVTASDGGGTASSAISCQVYGGKNQDRHLDVLVTISDGTSPVDSAVVGVSITLPDNSVSALSATTGADGVATFSFKNAASGDYVTMVDSVDASAAGLGWDGVKTSYTCTK